MHSPPTNAKVLASAERYRMLLEINNAIITNLNQESLLKAICEIVHHVLPVYRAAITLHEPETDSIRLLAVSAQWNSDFFRVGSAIKSRDSLSGWVVAEKRTLLCRDLEAEMKYPGERRLLDEGIQSYCVVPLILEGKCIGTLNIGSDSKNQYSDADAEFLLQVANQVALAIANMKSYQEIAALKTKVELTAERYRTLLEINNAIITNLDREALLHAISVALRRVIPFDRAAFTLYDPKREKFRFLAIEGLAASSHFRAGQEFGREESITSWVFDHQIAAVRHDLEKEQQYPNDRRLIAEGLNSYCVVPLIIGGKSIGTLNLASKKTSQYSGAEADLLCGLANQVALAVCNMTSYEEIAALNTEVEHTAQRYRTLLEINNAIITNLTQQALLHAISEALHRVIPFDRCAITLYQPGNDSFRFLAVEGDLRSDYFRAGLEDGRNDTCIAWVYDHQRPLVRGDLEKERQYANEHRLASEGLLSLCVLPLVFQGKCIGTLSLVSQERDRYSNEDAAFLQEVANQVALAIANMQSFEEIAELKARLEKENVYLQEEIRTDHNFEEITGNSPSLLAVLRKVEQVAPTDSTVLISGETGTGKELIARAIHDRSNRKRHPLLKVNCSAISAGLVESELFGHVKGAFTGALERHIGRFELADGGTIFLDEIGELPLGTQVKLLRVLQEREFEPVGSNRPVRVDVRIIAATNRNLEESIRAGEFRSDLFYRLNVFPIVVPPLRERGSDIPQLAMFFLARFAKKFGKDIQGMPRETLDRLTSYSWPGNVRELQNIIERAVILSRSSVLELDPDLIPALSPADSTPDRGASSQEAAVPAISAPPPTLEGVERAHIIAVLNQTNGTVEGPRGAAKILGMHPNTLRHRMQKLKIKRNSHQAS